MNDVATARARRKPALGGPRPSQPPAAPPVRPAEEHTLADLGLLRSLLPYLKPHRLLLAAALLLVPVTSLATLVQPYLVKRVVDAVLAHPDPNEWTRMVGLFAIATVVHFCAGFVQTYTMQLAGQRSMADLRRQVFRKAQRMAVSYYDKTPVGRVLTRVTNDVDALSELFASGAVMAVADLVTLTGILCFMLALDYRLTLITFLVLPPLGVAVELIRRRAREAFRDIRARVSELNTYLSEQVQGVQIVQAYGREKASQAEYDRINQDYRGANYRAIYLDALLFSVVDTVSIVCVALVLWYASVHAGILHGTAGEAAYIGTVVAFYQYIQQFFVPIRDLSTKYTIIQSAMAAAERVFAFLSDTEVEPEDGARVPAAVRPSRVPNVDVAIEFSHVHFGYRPDESVLHDVSFQVKRGEHVALVGATGAGKSTTISLILRLYELTSGTIEVDGQDIYALSRQELRRLFAVVPQDVFLFAGTVAQNVAFSANEVDETRVRDVLSRVGALDLVERRPLGIHARVDERGSNFSAGERQLLAFARALYRDAPFLILDEATANIDSETEARLQAAVVELMRGRTAIVIAHRLSTIREADRIVVFHRGRVAEQGTHAELLALGEVYAHLHQIQFGHMEDIADIGSST
ncbi:MAG TPA: ABC transporter ATP-binding protein [Polyangiales bacterium]|nr:ABC transporter ATP-binding protein [Polyangiales bacterium]